MNIKGRFELIEVGLLEWVSVFTIDVWYCILDLLHIAVYPYIYILCL